MSLLPHCVASNRRRRDPGKGATSPLPLPPAYELGGDLDAETVAAVAVTRTQGHCCSPGSTTNAAPAALDIFSVSRAGARQGKGTESGAVSALRVLVWCAPPPWRQ